MWVFCTNFKFNISNRNSIASFLFCHTKINTYTRTTTKTHNFKPHTFKHNRRRRYTYKSYQLNPFVQFESIHVAMLLIGVPESLNTSTCPPAAFSPHNPYDNDLFEQISTLLFMMFIIHLESVTSCFIP
eukprot:213476_1